MATLTLEPNMAAKKAQAGKGPPEGGRSGKPKRDDVAVKADRTVIDKARLVASRRGITLAEYLTDLIRAPVERDFAKAVRELEGKG